MVGKDHVEESVEGMVGPEVFGNVVDDNGLVFGAGLGTRCAWVSLGGLRNERIYDVVYFGEEKCDLLP